MPNPCELIEDYVDALADVGPDEYTMSLTSTADAESGPYAVVSGDVEESFNADASPDIIHQSYNVSESFGISSTANDVQSITELVTDSVAVVGSAVSYLTENVLSTADAAASQGVVSIVGSMSSSANATASALFVVNKLYSVAESAVITSLPTATNTVEGEDVEETIDSSNSTSAVIDAMITDGITISATALPIQNWMVTASSSAAASADTSQSLVGNASIVSSAVIKATPLFDTGSQAFWSNTDRLAAATWSHVPFDSYASHEGDLLAVGAAGLYKFSGNTDAGVQINANIKTDLVDYGSPLQKCFEAVTVAATVSAPLRVTVTTEMGSFVYQTRKPSSTFPTNHVAPVGRGLVGRYVRVEIDNQVAGFEGSNFMANDASIRVGDTARKG